MSRFFYKAICFALLSLPLLASPVQAQQWSFSVSPTNNVQSKWDGLNESFVFFRRLTHTQLGKDWTIKIGKGGQLYSITTPQTGEMIGYQAPHGEWVDEVLQHTFTYPPKLGEGKGTDGDIHQAGYYKVEDSNLILPVIPHSTYSPLFLFRQNNDDSVSYTTWPQHAHLPRDQANNQLFINQTVKDLGDGVVEIQVILNNWSDHVFPSVTTPWATFRTQRLTSQIISTPSGDYVEDNRRITIDPATQVINNNTGGWLAVVQQPNPNAYGIGIVFGKNPLPADKKVNLLWGVSDPSSGGENVKWTTASVYRRLDFQPGETITIKYFLVLGKLSDIQAKGNQLQSQVSLSRKYISENEGILLPICASSPVPYRRGCPTGQTPAFYLYENFVKGSLPLFLLQNTTNGQYLLTSDPYKISFNPTDGKTKYVEFLGWTYPHSLATTSSLNYRLLKNLISNRTLFPATDADNILTVRPASDSPSSSPTSKLCDFNHDNQVNLLDYNLLVSGYGTTYNLSHYNQLVANYQP